MANQRISGVPQGLDPELVEKAGRGRKWGEEDQKRYDVMTGDRLTGKGARKIRTGEGNLDDRIGKLEAKKEAGVEFGGNAQRHLNSMNKRRDKIDARRAAKERTTNFAANPQTTDSQPAQPEDNPSVYAPFAGQDIKQKSSQEQNVNQDNDITSEVTGNNNYVSNTQDNSVRFYGGNTTNFNYQSTGEGPDTPATMMTLAGIGNPQDSPADTARFIGKYSDLNADAQKRYGNVGMDVANKYIARAAQTNPIDYEALDKQISQGIQNHYDQSTQQQALYQGDVFNYKTPEFKMPKPPAEIESNVSSIADDYKDDLDED